jgi:hypothetical protein
MSCAVPITQRFIAAHRHPDMRALYRDYIDAFRSAGLPSSGLPFVHFGSAGHPSQYGSWSVLEYTGQAPATAPKYLALADRAPAFANTVRAGGMFLRDCWRCRVTSGCRVFAVARARWWL